MKRYITISLLLLTITAIGFPQAKPGGIAREAAMGGLKTGSYLILNPFIMEDPTLILINPAYQAMYKDYVWGNVFYARENYGQQSAGVAFALGDNWSFGLNFNNDPLPINSIDTVTDIYPKLLTIPQI